MTDERREGEPEPMTQPGWAGWMWTEPIPSGAIPAEQTQLAAAGLRQSLMAPSQWDAVRELRGQLIAAEARIAELKAERSQRLASAYDSALPGDVLVSAELWNAVKANVERLQGENAALLADKARLDWLSRNPPNNERPMKPMTSLSREQIDGAIRDAVRSAPGGETP